MNQALLETMYGNQMKPSKVPLVHATSTEPTFDQLPAAVRTNPAFGVVGAKKKKVGGDAMQKALSKKQKVDPSTLSAGARDLMLKAYKI